MNLDQNAKLVRCARNTMRNYAILWRHLRIDDREVHRTARVLAEAIRLRDMANRWSKNPL